MSSSPNRLLATVVGAVYVLIGIAGFTATSGVGFFDTTGGLLFGVFGVNILHNIVHLLIGAALLLAGLSGVRESKTVTSVVGGVSLLLGLVGLFLVGSAANILAITAADNVLHFATAALLLAVGLGAERTQPA